MTTTDRGGRYRWATWGDLNAFFGLLIDNITNLVLLSVLLVAGFGYPAEVVFTHMVPGTAFGVMVGDLLYTWMGIRLARRKKDLDVTAMPLGLDTPSTIGMAAAVLGPCYLETGDAILTWKVGMATLILMGVLKTILSFCGDSIRRLVPRAGLLGSLAGIGLVLLGFLPLLEVFELPIVGLVALGLLLYSIVARLPLPGRIPGAFAAVVVGIAVYHVLGNTGLIHTYQPPVFELALVLPIPTLGFMDGMELALNYLPIAIPFGILTVVGGINVTESARAAGDEYSTRNVLLVEAVATLVAGVCGGVAQSTPYIGHPAYKAMGARTAYTLATALVVGIGGACGVITSVIKVLPAAAAAPILVFVGLEIMSQAFHVCPKRHLPAVAFACIPIVAELARIMISMFVENPRMAKVQLTTLGAHKWTVIYTFAHGFILTGMMWGAYLARLIDRRTGVAAIYCVICGVMTLFGLIHSVDPRGALYLPWLAPNPLSWRIALGYGAVALFTVVLGIRIRHSRNPG